MVIANLAAGGASVLVTAPLGQLPGDTDFHYRWRAQNADGITFTTDQVFRIPSTVRIDVGASGLAQNWSPLSGTIQFMDINQDGVMDFYIEGILTYEGSSSWDTKSYFVINNLTRYYGQTYPGALFADDNREQDNVALGWTAFEDFNHDNQLDYVKGGGATTALFDYQTRPTYFHPGLLSPKDTLYTTGTIPQAFGTHLRYPVYTQIPDADRTGVNQYRMAVSADLDNDGRIDVLSGERNQVYFNRGQIHVPQVSQSFVGADYVDFYPLATGATIDTTDGGMAVADYDGDGYVDVYTFNQSGSAGLYRNDGTGKFTLVAASGLPTNARLGQAAWADYDGDGQLDLAVSTGYEAGGGGLYTQVYRNNGNHTFSPAQANSITGELRYTSLAWGDMDHDGRPDLVVSGKGSGLNDGTVLVFLNRVGGFVQDFVDADACRSTSESSGGGGVAVADLNDDGRLDFAAMGESSQNGYPYNGKLLLYANQRGTPNLPPSVPVGLASTPGAGGAVLQWETATDDVTPTLGLSYNLRIGTTPGGCDVVAPLADPATGKRHVARLGNRYLARTAPMKLPPGTYYWSVQAVDGAFAGGLFAAEQSFTVGSTPITPQFLGNAAEPMAGTAQLSGIARVGFTPGSTFHFVYGTSPGYGFSTAAQPIDTHPEIGLQGFYAFTPAENPVSLQTFEATATGLTADRTYHAALVIQNAAGTFRGPDFTFTTPPSGAATVPGSTVTGSSLDFQPGETPAEAIDETGATVYKNYAQFSTGLTITTTPGAPVRCLSLFSAASPTANDPTSFLVEGSMDGTTFTLLNGGSIPAFPSRSSVQSFPIRNEIDWNYYRVTFPTVQNVTPLNPMEIGEINLLAWPEISSPADTVVVTPEGGGTITTSAAAALDRQLGTDNKLLQIQNNPSTVRVTITPGAGPSVLKNFELISGFNSSTDPEAYPTSVEVYGTDDGVNFTALGSFADLAPPSANLRIQRRLLIGSRKAYQSYSFVFGKQPGGTTWKLGELRLFGIGSNADPGLAASPHGAQVRLRWSTLPGYLLETTTDLTNGPWLPYNLRPSLISGKYELLYPMDAPARFFRMYQQ